MRLKHVGIKVQSDFMDIGEVVIMKIIIFLIFFLILGPPRDQEWL